MKRQLYFLAMGLLLVGSLSVAAMSSRAEDWRPVPLVALLAALVIAGQYLVVKIRNQILTASFVGIVLAMTLLGPAPAVFVGALAVVGVNARRRSALSVWFLDSATHVTYCLTGGLIVRGLVGDIHDAAHVGATHTVDFGLLVFGVFLVTNTLNFALVAANHRALDGDALLGQVRYLFVPLLPGQVATGALAAILAVAYSELGYSALLGLVLVLAIFQYLGAALIRSEERADQLEARSIRLASLQLGVLVTLVETLALRDRAAARHAAAVARYSRALAAEVGCSESDQDVVHSAGLLHDIGKFALPDSILHATEVSERDRAVIRRHPQEGATLVGRLDGYGPVSDVILYHHEHIDGSGYPAGLISQEIPFLARVLAIANAYDRLTARDSYDLSMTPQDAMAELRRMAGRRLDADLVDGFIAMLERDGPVTQVAGDDADFEAELAFERRTRLIAQPALR